jgi:hypothetical protein
LFGESTKLAKKVLRSVRKSFVLIHFLHYDMNGASGGYVVEDHIFEDALCVIDFPFAG